MVSSNFPFPEGNSINKPHLTYVEWRGLSLLENPNADLY